MNFCGFAHLFVHERAFRPCGNSGRVSRSLVMGARKTGVLVVVVFVVSDVELEREIRAQRNEAVEDGVVADGPRDATEDRQAPTPERVL